MIENFSVRSQRNYSGLITGLMLLLALAVVGCDNKDRVQAKLYQHVYGGETLLRLEIQGEITGPQDGLHYKWFSVSGECDPQESSTPMTKFKFGDHSARDRVTLEVWREDRRVARSEIDVTMSQEQMRLAMDREANVKIKITNVPPYDRYGGEATHAAIGGSVNGAFTPDCKVVIYARVLETWYIQPMDEASQPVASDGTWTNWTHTGASYAAILVSTNYAPESRRAILPSIGDDVVAETIVEGKKD
jgi:hypothetical protein